MRVQLLECFFTCLGCVNDVMDGGQHHGDDGIVAGQRYDNDIKGIDEAVYNVGCLGGEVAFVTAEERYDTCVKCIYANINENKEEKRKGKGKADSRGIRARSLFAIRIVLVK
jgi:hypothetical protein